MHLSHVPLNQLTILSSLDYVRSLQRSIREAEGQALKKKKGKGSDVDASKPVRLTLLISESFPEWQDKVIQIVAEMFANQTLDDNKKIREKIEPKEMKRAMPFVTLLKQRLATEDPETVFHRELQFNETDVVKAALDKIKTAGQTLKVEEFVAISFPHGSKFGKDIFTGAEVELPQASQRAIENAIPGNPGVVFQNI